ncbi:AfsR/SARP family transcriptional regulator [Nonomuraea harbinensis]|uniref:BTAD domain-containing putative transcriptional regulator n=1 Tax=Nonomuraea harbinensis TaxID=1286938 RepID=A0ABW1BWN0_9ACTN|nr:BTAD domain-containing putative transcriptional regulator [Nonomuraea harbinensis]
MRLPPKPRAVLTTLLLHPNTVVSKDRLVMSVWDDPPRSAWANLQSYVSLLRRAAIEVETHDQGYRLPLTPARLDLLAFGDAVRQARRQVALGNVDDALPLFEQAFLLWRGRPAEGAALGAALTPRISELEEQATSARLDWIDLRLRSDRHAELVGEVTALVEAAPLSERLWHRLMLALHRAGRRAEALEAYRRARSVLVSELGVEPGQELRDLHAALLDDAPAQRPPAPGRVVPGPASVCLLPPDVADFVGRDREARAMVEALRGTGTRSAAPLIVVVSGPPGVGKSTLAVHVSHRMREHYPDGQLFVRLDGASPAPRDPADLLAELLRALGVDGVMMPAAVEDRAALYRARIADRAVLVLLDDAGGEAQVQPLLPGTSRSAVVVTSRGPLPMLAGATALTLDVPSPADAREFLAEVVGADRVESAAEAAETIVRACGRLPLALRIAGARLVTRPAWPLAELAHRLTDASTRLDELRSGRLSIRRPFAMSYATLSDEARRAFQAFGHLGVDGVAAWSIGALLGEPARVVDHALEELTAAGLLTADEIDGAAQPRYHMHDLLRCFASELSGAESRSDALGRLAAEALARVTAASWELPHAVAPPRAQIPAPPSAEGRAWLLAERAVLVSAIEATAEAGMVSVAADLAYAFSAFGTVRGFHDDTGHVLDAVIRSARRHGDTRTETHTRLVRADVEIDRRRSHTVEPEFRALLAHFEAVADHHAGGYALVGLASCQFESGELEQALSNASKALSALRSAGDAHGMLAAWMVVAGVAVLQGRYDDIIRTCRRALEIATDDRSKVHRAGFLRGLGIACYETGRVEEAIGHYQASLDLSRELQWPKGVRATLRRLGEAHAALGRFDRAEGMLRESMEMCARAGDAQGEALTAFALGELCRRRGDERGALEYFTSCRARLGSTDGVWRTRTEHEIARSTAALSGPA